MILRILFTTVLSLAFIFTTVAQKEVKIRNFTQEEGLPSNESYFVFRDSKNYIWIATDQGVVRYNGIKMEYFNLPDNVIFKIREDSKGRIWFFSQTGKLAYFFNESVHPYKYNDSIVKYIKNIIITDAYVNAADDIIINNGEESNYIIHNNGIIEPVLYYKNNYTDSTIIDITEIGKDDLFSLFRNCNHYKLNDLYVNLHTGEHNVS